MSSRAAAVETARCSLDGELMNAPSVPGFSHVPSFSSTVSRGADELGSVPSVPELPQMGNVLVRTLRVWFRDASHPDVCHLVLLSYLLAAARTVLHDSSVADLVAELHENGLVFSRSTTGVVPWHPAPA
jgi:hypothetical protein